MQAQNKLHHAHGQEHKRCQQAPISSSCKAPASSRAPAAVVWQQRAAPAALPRHQPLTSERRRCTQWPCTDLEDLLLRDLPHHAIELELWCAMNRAGLDGTSKQNAGSKTQALCVAPRCQPCDLCTREAVSTTSLPCLQRSPTVHGAATAASVVPSAPRRPRKTQATQPEAQCIFPYGQFVQGVPGWRVHQSAATQRDATCPPPQAARVPTWYVWRSDWPPGRPSMSFGAATHSPCTECTTHGG